MMSSVDWIRERDTNMREKVDQQNNNKKRKNEEEKGVLLIV